jgi:AhpD family alkylhydroperoxidase
MALDQTKKELAAIGASIGARCRPCIEHHVGAAREAGLSDDEIAGAIAEAEAVRGLAAELLSARTRELLGESGGATRQTDASGESGTQGLAALGASIGANAHSQLEGYVQAALASGLTADQAQAAIRMAEHVKRRAAEITAEKVSTALEESNAVS